ncbi:MAG TPA: hypothetical protein PLN05_17220 [Pyrinomonadaceae bacterium]|nr:hypothetical protein [Chloracidobacterium sp.]HRJ88294.1 hypothetical protein [Pyrinomonadaceae bacterium]HRK52164.1 hypothetical protein [Pyrinomonadaceae bacterium]
MTDWRLLVDEGRFEEAEPVMLEATSKPDPYGDLLIQKAAFYESWGDALGHTEEAVRKYWLSHAEWAWFASGATSGGEGTARMLDVNRVLKKIENVSSR